MAGTTSNPKVTIQLLPSPQITAFAGRRDLIIGQLPSAATAVSGALNLNVESLTEAEVYTLFGAKSELSHRVIQWKDGNGNYSQLDVIGIDESGTAVQATGDATFTGTATAAGTVSVAFVDEKLYTFTLSVASGTTAASIATQIETLMNASTNLPGQGVAGPGGRIALLAHDGGTIGNFYGVKASSDTPGITVAVTAFASGANDPTLTTILDPIDGIRYTGISWPEWWRSDLDIPVDELDTRFNASNAIMDGVCFTGQSDTLANDLTFVNAQNSQSLVAAGNNKISNTSHAGPAVLQPADWAMAYFMGVRSKRLTPDAPVASQLTTTSGPLDAIGGPSNASLPYFNTPMDQIQVEQPTNLFSASDQSTLEAAGMTTYGVNSALNNMIMGPVVTTWTTDAAGNPNTSFSYLNFVDTGSACREIFFNELKSAFSQSRLTEGDLVRGRSMANAESIKAFLLSVYKDLAAQALTQAGSEAEGYFARNTTVTVSLATRTVTIDGPLPIVSQLATINYPLQLSFSVSE